MTVPHTAPRPRDAYDVALVRRSRGMLRAFNDAGVLAPADVHVAATLGRLCGETDEGALLAAGLAVRAPRLGHVCVDLATVRSTVTVDADAPVQLDALPWPDAGWVRAVAASRLVAAGQEEGSDAGGGGGGSGSGGGESDAGGDRPLRLAGTRLYLDRYWVYEQQVRDDLHRRTAAPSIAVDADRLRAGLDRLFPAGARTERPDRQRLAAATAVLRRFAVIAGGPGTGKTTTVAKVLALLAGQWPPGELPRVALAAPTGKAADRVGKSVQNSIGGLDVDDGVRGWLSTVGASTLHRLLGRRPGSDTRFRHDRSNPLPADVVVVDEASMVSLALMAKLLDAVRPDARLVLLGDPEQLASVEAGAVLGDIVGPTRTSSLMTDGGRREIADLTGQEVPADQAPSQARLADAIVVLRRRHRFAEESGIAALARAIQTGDADTVVALLREPGVDVRWVPVAGDDRGRADAALSPVRDAVVAAAAPVLTAARAGDGDAALRALGSLRLLCGHRRGPYGVAAWVPAVEQWLARRLDGFDASGSWYLGQPILITRNDYQLNLLNGDVGVVVAEEDGRPTVAFSSAAGVRTVSPVRLDAYETVHAMTVHKSQGSQFVGVVVVLPEATSPVLTRELLYTAVTRAEQQVTVVAPEDAVRAAVARPIQRASGLRAALWGA